MLINRKHICEVFKDYTDKYNSSETKIKLKIDHTYRVAGLSDLIAKSLGLSQDDIDLAWTIGMLHDIGRFEQVRIYNTFSDAESIDHAGFGADLLYKKGLIKEFIEYVDSTISEVDAKKLQVIELAVRNHSAYRIEEGLDDRQVMFCNIIRDADKIDILKVNAELPLEEIYNVTTQQIENATVTPEVLEAFREEHAVLRKLKKTPVDNVVGHISLVYELVFSESYRQLDKQGYIYKLLSFSSKNEKTVRDFEEIENHMRGYIKEKRGE